MPSPDPAAALRMLRGLRRRSQRELARQTGVHHATISQFERGKRSLGQADLGRLLDGLNVTPRAYEATERHVAWIDYLTGPQRGDPDRESLLVAEALARSFEVHTSVLLQLVEAVSGGRR